MSDYTLGTKHIDHVMPGDVILHQGKLVTLGARDIKRDPFMGKTVLGDCYKLGTQPVTVATFGIKVK